MEATSDDGPRLRTAKMSEAVARALLEHVEAHDLQPGDSLPNERDAIEWLGVARGSLREGLRLLENHGVISVRSGRHGGPVVRSRNPETFAGSTTLFMQYMRVRFEEVLDARIAFEPQIARAAAEHRTKEQLKQLLEAVNEMADLVTAKGRFRAPYDVFHRTVAEASANPVLIMAGETFRKVWEAIHAEVNFTEDPLVALVKGHRQFANAIAVQDPDTAADAARAHLIAYRAWLAANQPELLRKRVEWVGVA